ncbi:MAG: hypothetical protein RBT71_06720 [Flavobacteriales bacterium]|jgi:hypothetical protein|nr:hypothetical protein [Flavobacteriales bacterium]
MVNKIDIVNVPIGPAGSFHFRGKRTRAHARDRYKDPRAQALHEKGMEVQEPVRNILEAAPEDKLDDEMSQREMDYLTADARLLTVKIAGAGAGGLYDLRMHAASIIRKAATDLVLGRRGLGSYGYHGPGCFDLLRAAIEEFRQPFVARVEGFDRTRYLVDRWGVSDPPGVGPHDEGPEWPFGSGAADEADDEDP